MNGLVKIPMQFLILLIGVLVFTFYQFHQPPLFFNKYELNKLEKSEYKAELNQIRTEYDKAFNDKQALTIQLGDAIENKDEALINESRISLKLADEKTKSLRKGLTDLMQKK